MHSFSNLRARYSSNEPQHKRELNFFLGGELPIDAAVYRKAISRADDMKPPDSEMTYLMHRNERFDHARRMIPTQKWRIETNRQPVELEILKSGRVPARVFGTVSTALLTLRLLSPEAEIYALDIRDPGTQNLDLNRLYDLFGERKINVIPIV